MACVNLRKRSAQQDWQYEGAAGPGLSSLGGLMWQEDREKLIGQTVVAYDLHPSGDHLILKTENGKSFRFDPCGDCCSTSWIESIDMPEVLLGTISDIEELDLPHRGDVGTAKHPDVDSVAYYGLKITTQKGSAVVDYRNDSNGYYGGWLDIVEL